MKNKDIIKLLQSVDEEAAVQLSEEYHGISEKDNRRLRKKVRRILLDQDYSEYEFFTEKVTVKSTKFSWISKTATAAAYVLVFGGIAAGLFNMNMPVTEEEKQQELSNIPIIEVYENNYMHNMVSSGALKANLIKSGFSESGIYQITIEITSENAISLNGTRTFFADNLMAAYTTENGIESTVYPCGISDTGELYPYAFTLYDGECCELTLNYSLETAPDALISGHSEKALFFKLTED